MVIYLPLIVMNVLNQASFYLTTEDKYQMVITVNITCLLALASVYMGVATSLPSTANIKPVEFYLIYNLIYPFLTIMLAVYIQVRLLAFYCKFKSKTKIPILFNSDSGCGN